MNNLSAGQQVKTKTFTVLRFNQSLETVQVQFQLEDYSTLPEDLPLSLPCFKVSPFGSKGFCHPTQPGSGIEQCVWVDESKNQVRHRLLNEVCHLVLSDDFHITGDYKLTPVGEGEIRALKASRWDNATLYKHMEEMKGKELVLEGHIFTIHDPVTDRFHTSIMNSTTMLINKVLVFILFPYGLIHPVSLKCIDFPTLHRDEFDHTTRKRKRKLKK